jgi:hypothetical protein
MHDHASAVPSGPVTLTVLVRRYGDSWEIIEHSGLHIVSAEHRSGDGRHIRYLVAHSAAELAGKLETAELVEP